MNEEQAVRIVKAFANNVDSGCMHCASQAVDCLVDEFPEMDWLRIAELAVGEEDVRAILSEVENEAIRARLDVV